MARIIYALSGQGRGHTSRVMAISDALRHRGHEILFCCGGTAQDILEAKGETVLQVPAVRQVLKGNKVQVHKTLLCNSQSIRNLSPLVSDLADAFADFRPDLLITDFEAFSPRAAERIGLPILSFNHQQVISETSYALPIRYYPDAALARLAIYLIAPRRPDHILLSSFFFPPVKRPDHTTLVPPIIRSAVQNTQPRQGDHVLVYYNQPEGANHVLEILRLVDASFIVYNFDPPTNPDSYPNLQFKSPCIDGFLTDLATSRAVLCTAGFTLISEALYLGKPLLVVPNRGIFEQTINALFLEREKLGNAILHRPLQTRDVTTFLNHLDTFEARLRNRPACGNTEALDCIEKVLRQIQPSRYPRAALPFETA